MYYYDDPNFSYPAFWEMREYEHEAELLAIQRLLGERRFATAVDVGGGFGRLSQCLLRYARKVIVIEPSETQRALLASFSPETLNKEGSAAHSGLPAKSVDLVVMVRVAHHLSDLHDAIGEAYTILKPGGYFLLEFANSTHFKSRVLHYMTLRTIPVEPLHVNADEKEIPFVNHHPAFVKKLLRREGFIILQELSVSNFRSPLIKKLFSVPTLLRWEESVQKLLAFMHFGPSVFILAKRPGR